MKRREEELESVLHEFVTDIETTGGLVHHSSGSLYPAGDPEWTDLTDTYLNACRVLGRKPKIVEQEDYNAANGLDDQD